MKIQKICLIISTITLFSFQVKSQCNDNGIKGPPDERVIDRLKEGDIYGNPYTMFVREVGFNLDSTISKIRNELMKGQPFENGQPGIYSLYLNLYNFANQNGYSACDVDAKDNCPHPAWVKANAVIYLIRLYPVYSGAYVSFNLFSPDSADRYATRA